MVNNFVEKPETFFLTIKTKSFESPKIALCKSPVCSVLDNQEALKSTLQATTFEVEENSRTSPKIQGLARLCKPCYFTQQAIVETSHLFV